MKISYYKLERPDVEGGFRTYWLMEGDKQARMIHISSLIRLQGLLFSPGPGGQQDESLEHALFAAANTE